MARTTLNPNQVNENTLEDADGNTKVQVEESSDENKIRFDTAGTERMIIDSNGRVGIGTSSPTTAFHVYADAANAYVATIDNDAGSSAHGLKVETDGTGAGSLILDLKNGSSTVFKVRADGRVGIGVDTPGSTLAVDDEIAVGEKLLHRGDPDTYLQFPSNDNITFAAGGSEELKIASDGVLIKEYVIHDGDENTWMRFVDDGMTFKAGGISFINLDQKASAPHELTFNDGSNNIDLVVKGNGSGAGNPGMKFDASTNKLGINGVGTPDEALHVWGNIKVDGTEPTIIFNESGADRAVIGVNSSDNILIENKTMNKHIVFKVNDQGVTKEGFRLDGAVPEVVVNQTSDSLVDFRVESDNNTHMMFVDGSEDTVGINTSAPKCSLSIAGSLALNITGINSSNDPGTTYSMAATDCVLLVNTRPTNEGGINSAITITLPAAASFPGRVVVIKDAAGFADINSITISRAGSDLINGIDQTVAMSTPASYKVLISDGSSAWQEIG